MLSHTEAAPTRTAHEFCLALKTARERKGITLAAIAETTKIPASLFAALEREDLRHWPSGIFRRSFFRDYAREIGVPVSEWCEEFLRLFPDGGAARVTEAVERGDVSHVADERQVSIDAVSISLPARLLAAVIDALVIVFTALSIAWVANTHPYLTIAIVALTYLSASTALFGESLAKRAIVRRRHILQRFKAANRDQHREASRNDQIAVEHPRKQRYVLVP